MRLVRLVGVLLLFLTVGVGGVWAQESDEDLEATIEAQQDEIADLQTQVAELTGPPAGTPFAMVPTVTADAQDEVDEESGDGAELAPALGGNALDLLPAGESDDLEVVLVGTYDGNILPIVLRNNSDEVLSDISINATVRDSGGNITGAGADQGVRPAIVEPGAYTLGYIYFDGVDLPANAEYEFDASGDEPATSGYRPLNATIDEAAFLSDRIVGQFSNPNNEAMVGSVGIFATCLDGSGNVVAMRFTYADQEGIDAGDSGAFQIELYGEIECENFLVGISGNADF